MQARPCVQRMVPAHRALYGGRVHEFSLCRAIATTVEQHAGGRPVEVVRLRIGHFRQVVPDTMIHCWELQTRGTQLDGSLLHIDSVAATVTCRECGATTVLELPLLRCGSCDSLATDLVTGEEFLIESIDVAPDVTVTQEA